MPKPAFLPHGRPRKRKTPPDPKKPETWYTRSEAAKILGVAKNTVAQWDDHLLHPVLIDGFYRYHPAEVGGIKDRRRKKMGEPHVGPTKGEIAAAAFKMLDDGSTRSEMVIALHITPEEAQEYWEAHRLDFEQYAALRKQQREETRLEKLEAEERTNSEKRRNDRMVRLKAMVEADAGHYKLTGGTK